MKNTNFLKLIIALIIPQLFAIIGSLFTVTSEGSWYDLLLKPGFNPPNWLFGPVWTILFILMGIAAFLIWRKGLERKEIRFALLIFVFQLALNLFWSFIFFTLKSPAIAFSEIISLWFAILATTLAFYQISKPAAYLLIPYIIWISFAALLNYNIWMLNKDVNFNVPLIQKADQVDNNFDNDSVINEDTLIELKIEE